MRFEYTLNWDGHCRWRPTTTLIDLEVTSPDDHMAKLIRKRGSFYESDLLEHIALRGPRGGMFIDVGASFGNHSVYFGRFLADCVVAVEPSPELVPVLKRNLEHNGVANALVFACGAAARSGLGRVVAPPASAHNIGFTRLELLPFDAGTSDAPDVVPVKTLDEIVAQAEQKLDCTKVSFVKIDVEGMELDVLEGATDMLARHCPQLAVELSTEDALAAVGAFLGKRGYEPVGRFCATPTYHFNNPRVHKLRKPPSRLARWWHR